ncbi:MAG: hypothetical protein RMM17_08250 [Acidobacteriota bacterium]|nr:hypothetical protein [Blastocatellia bacterium]MDW8412657.1 hypothetical protein [Acidobacteriota bacterium]
MSNFVTKKYFISVAVLDMNAGYKNQGIRCINEILKEAVINWNSDSASQVEIKVEHFAVRDKDEVPNHTFDIYISSGGPGSPFDGAGRAWEPKYYRLLDDVLEHNLTKKKKTYFFAICHSLQVMTNKFGFAEVTPAPRPIYGIMPVYPTQEGTQSYLLKDLADRFFAFERRNYQVVNPDYSVLEKLGAKVLAIESRNGLKGKAVMALSIGQEFKATQFHPEADSESVLRNFLDPEKQPEILAMNGEELFNKMLASLRSEDRVQKTRKTILPKFLARAFDHFTGEEHQIESDESEII